MAESSGKWKLGFIVTGVIGVIAVGISISMMSDDDSGEIKSSAKIEIGKHNNENVTGISDKGSKLYNDKIKLQSEGEIKQAQKEGRSYIPPIEIVKNNKIDMSLEVSKPQAPKNSNIIYNNGNYIKKPTLQKSKTSKKGLERERLRMAQEKKLIISKSKLMSKALLSNSYRERISRQQTSVFVSEQVKLAKAIEAKQKRALIKRETIKENNKAHNLFKIGDMLVASVDLHLNSDEGGPVLSTIIAGPLKGSKLFGSFVRRDERLVIMFNNMTLLNGETIGMSGYAVDPNLSKASVADAVDNHYISRWGGLVASSFLEGFANATENSGKTTNTGALGSALASSNPEYSIAEKSWIAAGTVASKLGEIALKNFDRDPTVELYPTFKDGNPIGILIVGK